MKFQTLLFPFLLTALLFSTLYSEESMKSLKAVKIISPIESTNPLVMTREFSVSKYGKGLYRIDGMQSYGRLNCIFLSFEAASIANVTAKEIQWTENVVETSGKKVLSKEAVLLNPFPREEGASAAILRVRVDAADKELLGSLSKTAEEIIKSSIQPVPDSIPREMF